MSVRILSKVFKYSESTLAGRLVLLALADAAWDDGVTWADQEALAEKARVSEQTVRRALRDLESSGQIETRKAQRGRRRVNVYRVLVPGIDEPDYDRLPFVLAEPFTTAQSKRSSEDDDRASRPGTTAHLGPDSADTPLIGPVSNRKEGANAPSAESLPPSLVKVDGRNLALDALADVCHLEPGEPLYQAAIVALNGRLTPKTKKLAEVGIVHLAWRELCRWAEREKHDAAATFIAELRDDPAAWSDGLAQMIRRKAARYHQEMPGIVITPKALRDWWLRLENMPTGGSGLSADDLVRMGQ